MIISRQYKLGRLYPFLLRILIRRHIPLLLSLEDNADDRLQLHEEQARTWWSLQNNLRFSLWRERISPCPPASKAGSSLASDIDKGWWSRNMSLWNDRQFMHIHVHTLQSLQHISALTLRLCCLSQGSQTFSAFSKLAMSMRLRMKLLVGN